MIVLLVPLYWVMREFFDRWYGRLDDPPTDMSDPMFAGLEDL